MKRLFFWKKVAEKGDARIDRVGRELVRAASRAAASAAATDDARAPFLYARIRAAIAEKQRAEAAAREFSFSMLTVMRHAMPLMAVTTFVSLMLLFTGTVTTRVNTPDETVMDTRAAYFDRVVWDEDNRPLSRDEVLATIIADTGDDHVNGEEQR